MQYIGDFSRFMVHKGGAGGLSHGRCVAAAGRPSCLLSQVGSQVMT